MQRGRAAFVLAVTTTLSVVSAVTCGPLEDDARAVRFDAGPCKRSPFDPLYTSPNGSEVKEMVGVGDRIFVAVRPPPPYDEEGAIVGFDVCTGEERYRRPEAALSMRAANGAVCWLSRTQIGCALGDATITIDPGRPPTEIATDGDAVYWIDESRSKVRGRPIGAGATTTLYASGNAPVLNGIFMDEASVFVRTLDGILRLPRGGGAPETIVVGDVFPIFIDETHLYFFVDNPSAAALERVPKNGTSREVVAGGEALRGLRSLQVHDERLYLLYESFVARGPKAGGALQTIDRGGSTYKRFWVTDDAIAVTDGFKVIGRVKPP